MSEPLSPESIAAEIEAAWLKLCAWPHHRPPASVCITKRGKVLVGAKGDRYAFATEVGVFNHTISLRDLRDEVFHVWESMHR